MSITENTISASLEGKSKKIGEFVLVNGEWCFVPDFNGRLWTAWMFRKIADLLDEKNKSK